MRTPKEYTDNLKKKTITESMLLDCLYSVNKRAKNYIGLNLEMDAILAVALGGNFLGGGKFSLIGSVIGAYTIQALTTTLYAMNVKADQLPVYKAIVVVIIVTLQSDVFKKYIANLKAKRSVAAEGGQK